MESERKININLILYLISLVIMGSNGIVASFINLTSLEIILMRTIIGSAVLITACIIHKEKFACLHDKHDALFLLLSGLTLGGGWIFLFEAYRTIGVSISTLLYYLGPIIAMLLSPLFFNEELTKVKLIGAAIVFIGVLLLNGNIAGDPSKAYGILCGFMSGVFYAVTVILNKKVRNATGMENTTCQLVASFFLVFTFLMATTGIHIKITGTEWIPVLWIGLLNTGLSCFFYYSTITKLPMSTVAILSYLDPVSAVILSALILHESLSFIQIIGVILVIGGAAFSQLYPIYKIIKLQKIKK